MKCEAFKKEVVFFITLVLIFQLADSSVAFPPEDVAISTARNILNQFQEKCDDPLYISEGHSGMLPRYALNLLGWPAGSAVFDYREKNRMCLKMREITMVTLNARNPRADFSQPPEFPSNDKLSKMSVKELKKIVSEAIMIATPDAHRVIVFYLEKVRSSYNQRRDRKKDNPYLANALRNMRLNPVPETVPILIDLAVNPYAAERNLYDNKESLRFTAINALSQIYHNTLTGLIYIAMVEDLPYSTDIYIDLATKPSAELDIELVKKYLRDNKTDVDSKVRIVDALGDSGNRSYRKIIRPFINDSEEQLRYAAARAMAVLGDGIGFDLLKQQVNQLSYEDNKYNLTIRALGRLGDKASVELVLTKLEDKINNLKKDAYPAFTDELIALADSGDYSILDKLFELYFNKGTRHPQIADTISALSNIEAVPILTKYLEDKDIEKQKMAAILIVKAAQLPISSEDNMIQEVKGKLKGKK